jgi:uncharacterized membrane protein YkoI
MQKDFRYQALAALCFLLLALTLSGQGLAQQAASRSLSQVNISPFRIVAEDALAIVNSGNLKRAKARIKDLETDWDRAEAKLRPRSPEQWRAIDKAIDAALLQLRADSPRAPAAKEALQNLLVELGRPDQSAAAAPGKTEASDLAKLPITDIVAVVEKLQGGTRVLDVSFEPKDGQPAYLVRTYANGKIWDGLLDGVTGAAIGGGTVIDELALDDEDKAEVAASKHAKITLRQAIETAEKAGEGRALNAGLEQVRGRVVWEILIQNTKVSRQVHIDPITGEIL